MSQVKNKKLPKEYKEKLTKLQAAYDTFLTELGVVEKKRRELVEKMVKRIDQKKIQDILSSIK